MEPKGKTRRETVEAALDILGDLINERSFSLYAGFATPLSPIGIEIQVFSGTIALLAKRHGASVTQYEENGYLYSSALIDGVYFSECKREGGYDVS